MVLHTGTCENRALEYVFTANHCGSRVSRSRAFSAIAQERRILDGFDQNIRSSLSVYNSP